MNITQRLWISAVNQVRGWSWLKRTYAVIFGLGFLISSFLFLTPAGELAREKMAQTVITTQHREWAWMFVGREKRDRMVAQLHLDRERWGSERQNFEMITINKTSKRTPDELIKVEDISGALWKGKKMYVYDPRTIRVVVPGKSGEGERITSMVERTGAVAGINGGGFVDPDGLGNGFAPIGFIISGGDILYTDQDGSIAQHVVGFTKEGMLVVGKYTIDQLNEMGVKEAVMFYPRIIANGKGLITSGDGGWGRGPRTAIGQKEDGTVIIMVIDGRQTHSVGATLKEIQELMLAEGVINAGFLDGGASSELVTHDGGLITEPSSRYGERRLPSALLVFAEPEMYVANNPWDGVTEIDPGGAYDHPDFLKEQAELRAQGKLNPSKSPTPTPTPSETPEGSGSPKASASPGGSAKPAVGSGSAAGNSGKPAGSSGNPAGSSGKPAGSSGTPAGSSGKPAGSSDKPAGGSASEATPTSGDRSPPANGEATPKVTPSVNPSTKASTPAGSVKPTDVSALQQNPAITQAPPNAAATPKNGD